MPVPFVDLRVPPGPLQDELLAAVRRVLEHGQYILGPEVNELEERLARRLGAGHVIAVASGIDALILGLELRGIGPGDQVIVPSHSFVASALAIDLVGAEPVFADIDPRSLLLDPEAAAAAIGPRCKAIMPVHLMGHPCPMDAFAELAARHRLALIEDCAQAIGARFRGRSVGSDGVGAFSLHPLKILGAAGDAGFVTVAGEADAERLRQWRNLGLVDRGVAGEVARHSRLDTIHAAMLLVRLEHFDELLAIRRAHADAYRDALAGSFELVEPVAGAEPVDSAFVIRHPRRDELIESLSKSGFDLKVHYRVPIHRQPVYRDRAGVALPHTDAAIAEIASLPVGPELAAGDRDRLIEALLDWARRG